jgi:hypothetical protein
LTPQEAANLIGCSARHVRVLIQRGRFPGAVLIITDHCRAQWFIPKEEAEQYRTIPQTKGWLRGRKRKLIVP